MLDEVLEQPNGVRFLRRVVERKFTSPLLLVGPEGVGRRFSAVQAAKEIFCTGTKAAGCKCPHCTQIDAGMHPDLMYVGPDEGEVKVASIRALLEECKGYPSTADYRVLILEGADRMNTASANALLKTLEEPPSSVIFFLLAEQLSRVIPTIRSRCGLVQYQAISEPLIVSVLQRSEDDFTKALIIARMSEGSIGRAVQYMGAGRLSLRDKVFHLLRLALEKNAPGLFVSIDAIEKELPLALRFLEQLVHDNLMLRSAPTRVIHTDIAEAIGQVGKNVATDRWYSLLHSVRGLQEKLRSRLVRATDKSFTFQVKNLFAQAFWV